MSPPPRDHESARRAHARANRFQQFFEEDRYTLLKNHLYNYLLRKRAIVRSFRDERPDLILEAGSGISPSITDSDRIVYLDISFLALRTLKRTHGRGWHVVAECQRLPFADGAFSHVICAEVLEHIEDDCVAIAEAARVLAHGGAMIVNFPHRRFYYTVDDRFVQHHRRYEIKDMAERLQEAGLRPVCIRKVLGPLDKVTMCLTVLCYRISHRISPRSQGRRRSAAFLALTAFLFKWVNRLYACLAWLDARLVPRALATQLLMKAKKE